MKLPSLKKLRQRVGTETIGSRYRQNQFGPQRAGQTQIRIDVPGKGAEEVAHEVFRLPHPDERLH